MVVSPVRHRDAAPPCRWGGWTRKMCHNCISRREVVCQGPWPERGGYSIWDRLGLGVSILYNQKLEVSVGYLGGGIRRFGKMLYRGKSWVAEKKFPKGGDILHCVNCGGFCLGNVATTTPPALRTYPSDILRFHLFRCSLLIHIWFRFLSFPRTCFA